MLSKRRLSRVLLLAFLAALLCMAGGRNGIMAAAGEAATTASLTAVSADSAAGAGSGHGVTDALSRILLVVTLILVLAKLGGELLERIGQPAVLGELVFGIVLGNLGLLGLPGFSTFMADVVHNPEVDRFVTILAEIGVMLLLFEVGLEATVKEMTSVGASAFMVATLGVVAPVGLGFVVGELFLSQEHWTVHMFLGAVLAATSVGITARVLRDIGRLQRRESRIILGAAVVDDVLGLVVVAVAQGIVFALNSGSPIAVGSLSMILVKALAFFVGAILIGRLVARLLYRWASVLRVQGVLLSLTLAWCFMIAYSGTLIGLAPIVGAFVAGLVVEEPTLAHWKDREHEIGEQIRPITTFLVPIFFVHMGMRVDLRVFSDWGVVGFAAALTSVAIIGKQVCSLGVLEKGLNRLAVGVGMIPRGEVGLIVASIGAGMKNAEGHPLIPASAFSATVIMVMVTTMVTPGLLKVVFERGDRKLLHAKAVVAEDPKET